jgi:hypothetical protein
MRDPLWMEGDDIALDDDTEEIEDDPDRLHDGFYDD